MSDEIRLQLSREPDGFGFLYGELRGGDEVHTVNIRPPEPKWAGDIKLEGYEPDPEDYIIYLDGEEVARVKETHALEDELTRVLVVE